MFRRWLSSFWRDNKEKIIKIAKLFGLLILISVIATMIFSTLKGNENNKSNKETILYNPGKTVISGSDIPEKEYQQDDNLVKTFIDYCNEQKIEEAYNLLTNECKEKLYPTLKEFVNSYYNIVFQQKREYSLQSWINEKGYSTYKIRFMDNFMSTGDYDQSDKYEDYITIVTKDNNKEDKKLNINSFIKTEEINKKTITDELEIEALSVDTYMNYVIYSISLKNKTEKDILLDSLDNASTIKLIGTNGASYKLDTINLRVLDLKIEVAEQKKINLRFSKTSGAGVIGNNIEFRKAITDYAMYRKDKQNYDSFKRISIDL